VFLAYDLLEIDGQDLRQQPLSHRRQQLDNLFPSPSTHIQPSPVFHPKDFEELQKIRNESSQIRSEGLMIKRKNSAYGIGRKRGDWWKWKVDADTVDAVLIYAQRGHGRRANLYTDFTFAIYKGEELVPFAKAYSGLTDAEILEVNKWIKLHTRESFGPVRSVDAELVFELAFEGINRSTRHKSGIAVRFPRIVRWRRDKSVKDIATLEELLSRIT
jgi:DNA ligase-1